MTKNNEYVGVDENFIPEEEKAKQHVSESIIGDDTRDRIKNGIRSGADYLTSDEGKEKAKSVGRKGLKVAKGIGIGYLVYVIIVAVIALAIFIIAFVMIGKGISQQDKMINEGHTMYETTLKEINSAQEKIDKSK